MKTMAGSGNPNLAGRALRWMMNTPWFYVLGSTVFFFGALMVVMIRWDHLTIIIPVAVVFEQVLAMWRKDARRTAARRDRDIRAKKKPTMRDRTGKLWAAAFALIAIPVAAGQYFQAWVRQLETVLPADWIVQAMAAGVVLIILWVEAFIRAREEAAPDSSEGPHPLLWRGKA